SELGMIVEATGGVIDKFTGDGFLAHFGVLESSETHCEDACWCAVRLREHLTKLNYARHIEDQPIISLGIGLHTGIIASGVITTFSKSEFTVLGSVVNTTSRIEGLTKFFSVDCLVSEDVYEACKTKFSFQRMPFEPLRGVSYSQATYWLLPTNVFMGNKFPST
ncbi:MAG: adenylate/guanylate cyclase domain-containing protein, partial [Proteobacteria bacterium]